MTDFYYITFKKAETENNFESVIIKNVLLTETRQNGYFFGSGISLVWKIDKIDKIQNV